MLVKNLEQSAINISVALVTRNRPDFLKRCLESWRSQTVAPFEIVVSDDSDEQYLNQVTELANQFNCVYVKGPRKGLYANRNNASVSCHGTHILSADDDHTHPTDYVEKISEILTDKPDQIWIFTERHPGELNAPLVCPAELSSKAIRGPVQPPQDPLNCASIADGSSVYPRQIFDRGLRYDETYTFGNMWYIWGKVLVKNDWRISFSKNTFVWHHTESGVARLSDIQFLKKQIEANLYVLFVHSWYVEPSLRTNLRSWIHLVRCFLLPTSGVNYKVAVRIDIVSALRLLMNAYSSRYLYKKQLSITLR